MRRLIALTALLAVVLVGCTEGPLPLTPPEPTATAVPSPTAIPAQPPATPPVAPTAAPTVAPQPQPAAMSAPAKPGQPSGTAAPCLTDTKVHDDLGLTRIDVFLVQTGVGVPWDGCKWNWQSNNKASISFTLPSPYQATLQFVGEGTSKVFYGPVELRNVKGMTIRYLPFFRIPDNDWVTDPCAITGHQNQGGLLKREMAFGFAPERGLRNFDSVSGNIDCKADGSYSLRGGTFGPQ